MDFTPRTLRNRILAILDTSDDMDGVHIDGDERSIVSAFDLPAIRMTVAGKEFFAVFYQLPEEDK